MIWVWRYEEWRWFLQTEELKYHLQGKWHQIRAERKSVILLGDQRMTIHTQNGL